MAHQTFLAQSAGSQKRYRDCLGISIKAGIFRIDLVAGFVELSLWRSRLRFFLRTIATVSIDFSASLLR